MRKILKHIHDLWAAGRRTDLYQFLVSLPNSAQVAQVGRTLSLDRHLRDFFRSMGRP